MSTADVAEVSVPATLQATIAARIDRLDPAAKRTLERSGGHRLAVQPGLLETLGIDPSLDDLVEGELDRSDHASPDNPSMCSTIR